MRSELTSETSPAPTVGTKIRTFPKPSAGINIPTEHNTNIQTKFD